MTPAEYLDPTRFSLTTRAGVSPLAQVVLDAITLDKLRACEAYGVALTAELAGRLAELETKEKARPDLLDWLDEAEAEG